MKATPAFQYARHASDEFNARLDASLTGLCAEVRRTLGQNLIAFINRLSFVENQQLPVYSTDKSQEMVIIPSKQIEDDWGANLRLHPEYYARSLLQLRWQPGRVYMTLYCEAL